MGSATKEAISASKAALAAIGTKADLATGEQLFSAGRVIGDSAQLLAALADPSAESAAKSGVIDTVFSALGATARGLLTSLVSQRWSDSDDLLAGIEEIGIRVLARSADSAAVIDRELFAFGTAVSSDAELELAVSSKLGTSAAKADLVVALLGGKASAQSIAIISQLVQQPRGRRIGALLRGAASIVADEDGQQIATVITAAPLGEKQLARLATSLSATAGRELRINHVIDPAIVGGIRVQIGDEIIDGSVASKLNDLRLQLAS
jgi:F-type H+-transporting ATPase subunit delta